MGRLLRSIFCGGALFFVMQPVSASTISLSTATHGDFFDLKLYLPHIPLGQSYTVNFNISVPDFSHLPSISYFSPPWCEGNECILGYGQFHFDWYYTAGAWPPAPFELSGKTAASGWITPQGAQGDDFGLHQFALTYTPKPGAPVA